MSKDISKEPNLITRPPVVTLLGHVDHGKTSLLSKIKGQNLTRKEFGGISQHTNAYQIEREFEGELRKITFIDTPGHAAFSEMRRRGGKIADLIILVVAADDGIQPQTKEAIAYAREAEVPIMVALNKMDLKTARPDEAKNGLSEVGLTPEDWDGQTTVIEVSAETGQGIDELLEMILLWAETSELDARPQDTFSGVVIESHLNPQRGSTAVVLVKTGTLKTGNVIYTGGIPAKVKALFLEGNKIPEAGPSTPVEVLGFSKVPEVGEKVTEEKEGSLKKRERPHPPTLQENEKNLNIILKADTVGTAQAVEAAVEKLVIDNVKTRIIQTGIGDITNSDVQLAADCQAQIFAFNTGFSLGAQELAKNTNVKVEIHNIIYKLIKEVTDTLKEKKRKLERALPGMGEIIEIFDLPLSGDQIAGTRIIAGTIKPDNQVSISRDGVKIHRGKIKSIEQKREELKKASKGNEVGLYIKPQWKMKVGDMIEVIQ